jgi:hypothetical protein
VIVRGLRRNAERGANLFRCPAASNRAQHFELPPREPEAELPPHWGHPVPRGLQHCGHGVGVELAVFDLAAQRDCRLLLRMRGAVRAGFDQRLVHLRRSEQFGGKRELVAAGATVITRAVDALVVPSDQRRQAGQRLRPSQHAFRVVRMHAHALRSVSLSARALAKTPLGIPTCPRSWSRAARRSVVISLGGRNAQRPRKPFGRPLPSQRSGNCPSVRRVSASKPRRPAKRSAVSQCARNPATVAARLLATPSRTPRTLARNDQRRRV